jgi:beta-lactam-binding protein with PASTA domain
MAGFRGSITDCLLGVAFAAALLLAACAKTPPLPPSPKPKPPLVDCRVPDLIEGSEQTVEPQLARARLYLGTVTVQESNQRPGTVIQQLPRPAATVKCWSRVDVWIAVPPKLKPEPPKPEPPKPELPKPESPKSAPPRLLTVPSLEGRDQMTATRMLEGAGLYLGEIGRRPSNGPRDLVVAQSPRAGTQVQPETHVHVWLAEPTMVVVPELRGRNQRSAAEALASVGLVVGVVREREDSSPRGTVLDQLPAPQSQVVSGASVALSIAVPRVHVAPPPPPPPAVQPLPPVQPPPSVQPSTPIAVAPLQVPPVVGLSLNQAFLRLESAGLRPGRVSEVREATAAGNVTAQFPAAGSAARPGAQVDLVVAASVSRAPGSWATAPPPPPTVTSRDPVQTFITERMRPASAAFYAPAQMQRDQPSEVLVEIAPPTISPADLAMELSIVAGKMKSVGVSVPRSATEGVTASGLIRAAPRMVANLSADRACTITPKDPLDRAVASDERVRWRWLVTPKVAGPISLTATLSAPVVLDGKETSYSIRSFDKTVTVLVTNQQRANDALEWAKNHWVMLVFAGGSFLGLLRWLWSHIRKPPPPPPPTPKQVPE